MLRQEIDVSLHGFKMGMFRFIHSYASLLDSKGTFWRRYHAWNPGDNAVECSYRPRSFLPFLFKLFSQEFQPRRVRRSNFMHTRESSISPISSDEETSGPSSPRRNRADSGSRLAAGPLGVGTRYQSRMQ